MRIRFFGNKFSFMGNLHLISYDIFISTDKMSVGEKENTRLVKEKRWCKAQAAADAKATKKLFQEKCGNNYTNWTVAQLNTLLVRWYTTQNLTKMSNQKR